MTDNRLALKKYSPPADLLELPEIAPADFSYKLDNPYPYGNEKNAENEDKIDLREIWRRVRKHKWMILSVVTICTTLVTLQVFRTKAWYTASTVIEIGKENSMVLKSEGLTLNDDSDPFYLVNVNTKKLALENPELFEKVIIDQKLDQNPVIIEKLQKKSLLSYLRFPAIKAALNPVEGLPVKTSPINEESLRLAPFVEYVQKNVVVEQIKNTRALKISYTDENSVLAADVANSIAKIFMQRSFNNQTEKFTNSAEWLDRSTRELKSKVQAAEEGLAKYTRDNQIYSTDLGSDNKNKTLTTSKLSQLHDQFLRTQTERMLKKSLYEQVQAGRINELPEAFSDPKIIQYQQQLSELEGQAAELKVKFGPNNPKILEVQNKINVLNSEIETSRKELEAKLNADYERAVKDEESLGTALAAAKLAAVNENQASIKYNILKQDVDTARGLYTDFLQKTNQANAQVAEQNNTIKVIQPAQMPFKPVGPNRLLIILGVLISSLGAGVGLAFFLEFINDTIKSVEDVERYVQLPILGIIPNIAISSSTGFLKRKKVRSEISLAQDGSQLGIEVIQNEVQSKLISNLDVHSMAGEAYRAIRTSLLLSTAGTPPKTILVTSSQASEGKSTTAVNIAVSLAQLGSKVLIIDCDLRRPSLHKNLDISSANGMTNYLSNNVELESLIQELSIPNLSAITSGPIPPNPAELLSSHKMKEMINLLSKLYDHIIIDSPPIMNVTDPIILSTLVDGIIMVIHSGKSSRGIVQRSRQDLLSVRAKIFGVVLNNVNFRREGYDYSYYRYKYNSKDNPYLSEN